MPALQLRSTDFGRARGPRSVARNELPDLRPQQPPAHAHVLLRLPARDHDLARLEAQQHDRRAQRAEDEPREHAALERAQVVQAAVHRVDVEALAVLQRHGRLRDDVLHLAVREPEPLRRDRPLQDARDLLGRQHALVPRRAARDHKLAAGEKQRRAVRLANPDRDCREAVAVVVAEGQHAVHKLEVDVLPVRHNLRR
eukprot:3933605-Rhodomonas_salina.2